MSTLKICLHLAQASVPVISDVAAIHDLAKQVLQILPWNPVVRLQVVVEDIARDDQVPCVERIRLVPALWTKLFPFRHNSVEKAKREEAKAGTR